MELGIQTDTAEDIERWPRLLRSLDFGDDDYGGCVYQVINYLEKRVGLDVVEDYIREAFGSEDNGRDDLYVSSKRVAQKLTFAPHVFKVPKNVRVDPALVSLMMPFDNETKPVHRAILVACRDAGLKCKRADDIWKDSVIIEDVFRLILESSIVISDLTGKNPNVLYETGIAHTLGRHVIPVAKTLDDVPFDLRHHRTLLYTSDANGLKKLEYELTEKLVDLVSNDEE